MKLNFLIIFLIYVYNVLGEISFIPKGQRAELFEIIDNEVPTFRIILPENEFAQLKRSANSIGSFDFMNNEIKTLINLLNKQNFTKLFPEYNFSKEFPELPINEDGFPNIDVTKFLITYDEFQNLIQKYNDTYDMLFNIYNNNTYLNLIKVIYLISKIANSYNIDYNIWKKIEMFINCLMMDNDGNFFYFKEDYIVNIYDIVSLLNEQNFNELFPGYNFTELLPELPMKENGHPNIDFKKYILPKDDYEELKKQFNDLDEIIFNILNNNDYLNLINVIYTLSTLNSFTMDNYDLNNIYYYIYSVIKDKDGNFVYISEEYIRDIKEIIDTVNHQNFTKLFPGYNFTENLPELPLNENGHPNIDFTKYIISNDEYIKLVNISASREEIYFNIFNKNDYLNLIKVFYTLYNLNVSSKDDNEFWDIINSYGNNVSIDEHGIFSYVNREYIIDIKKIVNSLNKQDFTELFTGYNLKEILPELPLNEDGHPNIDYQKYIISNDEYQILKNKFENNYEILFNIFNKDDYLNLIKVFHTLCNLKDFYRLYKLNVSYKDEDDIWYNIFKFGNNVFIDDDGNFNYVNKDYINDIEEIVDSLNREDFTELFSGYNFTELLPELPMNENGHPEIDFQKYIPPYEEYQKLEEIYDSKKEILFNIFNKDDYLNLIKVFYTLSNLNVPSDNDNYDIWYNINKFGDSVMLDDNDGRFKFIKNEKIIYIKNIVNNINQQNFTEIFPGYNFTEKISELPMKENGHPDIDYRKYIDINDLNQNLDNFSFDYAEYLYNTFNTDKYLNIVKLFKTLSQLNISSSDESEEFMSYIKQFINNVFLNDNDDFIHDSSKIDNNNDNLNITNLEEQKIDDIKINDFKTKNGKMTVEINNQKLSFNKITFSIGGQYSRSFSKPGFNLKIRGGKELFGRRQFKLRGEATEPSLMRTKLMCDIHNKLGLPSISANYATLYINDEFMGLYILTDAYKESWIEYVYGEKDTTNLYKCEDGELSYNKRSGFINENKEATDNQEFYEFLTQMTKAKSWKDVESIFDIDQFYKEIAIELISKSWDHFSNSHNYYIYKNPQNNKWTYLLHDFDLDLGVDQTEFESNISEDFNDLMKNSILNKLISNNEEHFIELLKEIVIKAFNPAMLFPRIDEIKTFIRPYVQLDKTANEDGQYPGRINRDDPSFYTMEQWEDSTEFDASLSGLKRFILLRYRNICQEYNMDCDPNYLDENSDNYLLVNTIESMATDTETETETISNLIPTSVVDSVVIETTTTSIEDTIVPTTISTFVDITTSVEDSIIPTVTSTLFEPTETEMLKPTSEIVASFKCLSEFIGYPCCTPKLTTIYAQDDYGDWSYDFKKKEWCGLTKYEDSSSQKDSEECWSEKLGYPCCQKCIIYETDSDGSWGYEFNQWCGIISSRC